MHYLADVLAGLALGALLVWAFHRLWPRARRWLADRPYRFFVVAGGVAVAAIGAGLFAMGSRNHFMYNAAALAAGAIVALLAEFRAVRFTPAPPEWSRVLSKVALGLLGLVPLAAADRLTGERAVWTGAALAFAGALWALLVCPAVFRAWGWGAPAQTPHPPEPAKGGR